VFAYCFWIIAGVLAAPALAGVILGVLLMVIALGLGLLVGGVCCIPLFVWLIVADAKFFRALTRGKIINN